MKKVIFIDDGIQFDSIQIKQKPYGGAEIAFVSLAEALAKLKYKIVVYNNCLNEGKHNGVEWKRLKKEDIENEFCDTLIVNRGDKYLNIKINCRKKIFWIHNPAKYLLKFRYIYKLLFSNFTIVFSSIYHLKTYPWWAPSGNRIIIPYGVDNKLLLRKKHKMKPPYPNAIFTSSPLRGLDWLLELWKTEIFPNIPNAKLNIFSGFSTYGKYGSKHKVRIKVILKKAKNYRKFGVNIFKPLERNKLFKEILKSRIFIYRSTDDETFCMAAAESQMLCIPGVVKKYGCIEERIIHNKTGLVCRDDKEFCKGTITLLKNDSTWLNFHKNLIKNNYYFSWPKIAEKWKKIIE